MSDDPLAARPPLRIGPSHMAAAVDQLSSRITELEADAEMAGKLVDEAIRQRDSLREAIERHVSLPIRNCDCVHCVELRAALEDPK